jgi:uncharacterized protein YprB with RNaseH-like and TPR domain
LDGRGHSFKAQGFVIGRSSASFSYRQRGHTGLKVAYFDIEATDLKPSIGRILAASVMDDKTGRVTTLRNDAYVKAGKAEDMADDHQLVVDLRDLLETYHITIGWYTKGYDITFINSRLIYYDELPLRSSLHLDAIWYAKGWRGIKPGSASLAATARFLGVNESKMEVGEDIWAKARGGNKAAMDVITKRCESDLRLTRDVVEKLLTAGLVKNISQYP